MNKKIGFFFSLGLFVSANLSGQFNDLAVHNEVKDSVIAGFNRGDFSSVYQLADTAAYSTSEQNFTRFLATNKRSFGQILNSTFIADSVCEGCNSKRAKYYLLEFELQTFMMVLEVTPQKKFSSFGLLNYTYPERTGVAAIQTDNPLLSPFDLSIDSAARDYFRNPHAAGLSIGIIKNGQRFTYHYGEATKGTRRLPTSKTLYELGSVGKTFTSTILANAVLENRLRLNEDIRRYLPGAYPDLAFKEHAITVQDLSNHTSGIPSLPDDFFTHPLFDPLKPWDNYSTAMFRQFLQRATIDTIPGHKGRYSNSGVALLGYILETIYQRSFDDLLKKYITGPFAMKHTTVLTEKKKMKNLASKYSANGNPVPYWRCPAYTAGGVGVVTCLDDMLNYIEHQIAETDPAIRLTHQFTANNSGLGWGIGNVGTRYKKYEHSGGTSGFSTNVRVFPEIKAGMVILANNDVNLGKFVRRISSLVVQ